MADDVGVRRERREALIEAIYVAASPGFPGVESAIDWISTHPVEALSLLGGIYNGRSTDDLGWWRFSMTDEQHEEARKQWEA